MLVASAKGVMTVDSKQVPNLSSGVYIMSNKSGIVKVDNDNTLNTLQKSVRSFFVEVDWVLIRDCSVPICFASYQFFNFWFSILLNEIN